MAGGADPVDEDGDGGRVTAEKGRKRSRRRRMGAAYLVLKPRPGGNHTAAADIASGETDAAGPEATAMEGGGQGGSCACAQPARLPSAGV